MSEPTDQHRLSDGDPTAQQDAFAQGDTAGQQNTPYTPPPKSGMGGGAKVAIGCGVIALLLLLGGCVGLGAILYANTDADDPDWAPMQTTTTTSTVAPSSSAITLAAFDRIQNGQSLQEVQALFQSPGREVASTEIAGLSVSTQVWQGPNFSNVTIIFQNNQVQSKSQFGLN